MDRFRTSGYIHPFHFNVRNSSANLRRLRLRDLARPIRTSEPVLALLLFSAPAAEAQDNKQENKQENKQDNNMVTLTNPDAKTIAAY